MEYDLNQWRNQMYQLENQKPENNPRLFHFQESDFGSSSSSNAETALPLFVAEPNSRISSLSANSRFLGIGVGLFSWIQWQELELQALIFKYMLAGVAVPIELIQSINKTSLTSPLCYLHYPPIPMFQSGYWGRGSIDPQPGRCRRTDGKKWRCSRDVVPDHKYCERHVNRGRNRSRKPVEIPTPASAGGAVSSLKMTNDSATLSTVVAGGTNFAHSISPYTKLLHLNQRSIENKAGNRFLVETDSNNFGREQKPSGQILRHFFDDWSRSDQESHDPDHNSSSAVSASCLSISTLPRNNSSSDFSLKLSTGNGNKRPEGNKRPGEQPQLNWEVGWGTYQVSPMGGPLAEALRPSTTNSSPTSVFHQLRRSSVSETSSISA